MPKGLGRRHLKPARVGFVPALAAVVILGCSMTNGQQRTSAEPTILREEINGLRFTLAVPDGYDGTRDSPLVVSLHPGGERPPFYGGILLTSLVEPALRELGAIMVAPDCTGQDWTDPRSEEDLLTVLQHVEEEYRLDPTRTLLLGFSMGGMGTWHLGARHQDRFRAAVIMAARPTPGAVEAPWEIPLHVIHSRADEVLPIQPTDQAVAELKARGVQIEYVVLDHLSHYRTTDYIDPLRNAVPWVLQAWDHISTKPAASRTAR